MPAFNSHLWVPSMEMQRWFTRWKTRRWPWDSAVTVLITFAFLLRAAEVRGGKKAKESRESSRLSHLLGEWTPGTAEAAFQRKPVRAAPAAGEARALLQPAPGAETRGEPRAARAGTSLPGATEGRLSVSLKLWMCF